MSVDYSYEYALGSEEAMEFLGVFFAIYAVVLLIVLGIGIAVKVIEMLFAKKSGAKLYGLVWLPIGNEYVTGQIADKYVDKKARIWYMVISIVTYIVTIAAIVMMIAPIVSFALKYGSSGMEPSDSEIMSMILSVFGSMALMFIPMIVLMVYQYVVWYRIYCLKDKDNATLWITLTIVLTIVTGIGAFLPLIFMCVNMNKPNHPKFEEAAPAQDVPLMLPVQVTESSESGNSDSSEQ